MARILVVEDEADIRQILEYNLKQAGHQVEAVATAEAALTSVAQKLPNLALLDVMLPDHPGTFVLQELRRSEPGKRVPVLMLTARGEERDRVVGFELGADDYVVKPFSVKELLLRISALLRRAGREDEDRTQRRLEFGVLAVDRQSHQAWVQGKPVELTALELRLLLQLHDRRPRVQTRVALLQDVWGISAEITTRTVDTHVKRLREKLGLAGDYIETVRGVGYRFAEEPGGTPP